MTERWRAIPSFPDYEASSEGRIRRAVPISRALNGYGAGRVLKTFPHKTLLYHFVGLYRDEKQISVTVHVCVCEAFHGPRPSERHQVAHGNGDRTDNRPRNLRWATPKENQADSGKHGTRPIGERRWNAKLSESDVRAIRATANGRGSAAVLSKQYGVTNSTIWALLNGKSWNHLK